MVKITQFSNTQLELLNLFNRPLPEEDLKMIKRLITAYLAEKLSQMADEVWEQKKMDKRRYEKFFGYSLANSL
jgi:transcriptional regulator of heat shock response